jgi:MYXO-CTERM domain-containing protein
MSVNGGAFTDLFSYTVLQSGGGGAPATWSSTTYNSIYTNTLSLGTAASNAASVVIRFVNTSTTVSAATGSNRIDNISVTEVPAPGALALLGVAGMVSSRRRR